MSACEHGRYNFDCAVCYPGEVEKERDEAIQKLAQAEARMKELEADRDSWIKQCEDARTMALDLGKQRDAAEADKSALREALEQCAHYLDHGYDGPVLTAYQLLSKVERALQLSPTKPGDGKEGFKPKSPWSPCIGDGCDHSSHRPPVQDGDSEGGRDGVS